MSELKLAVLDSAITDVQKTDQGIIEQHFVFSTNFLGFKGHFPEYPILPALVQILASQFMLENHQGVQLELDELFNAKFQKEIRPGMEVQVRCWQKGITAWEFLLEADGAPASSFLMTFNKKEGQVK